MFRNATLYMTPKSHMAKLPLAYNEKGYPGLYKRLQGLPDKKINKGKNKTTNDDN